MRDSKEHKAEQHKSNGGGEAGGVSEPSEAPKNV